MFDTWIILGGCVGVGILLTVAGWQRVSQARREAAASVDRMITLADRQRRQRVLAFPHEDFGA